MKILIVEDEKSLRDTIKQFLEREKFIVETAEYFNKAIDKINDYDYDCILLDITLPGGSGLSILKEIKEQRKRDSVIIISAKDSIEDKVYGLDLGADDYLAKPFHLAELNARINSIIRRKNADGDTSIRIENLQLFPDKRAVLVEGEELSLNRKEFDLLFYFISNPERLINKTALAESVWGDNIDQADSLDFVYSQVKNLRKKLKQANSIMNIKAVYGFGYKFVVDQDQ